MQSLLGEFPVTIDEKGRLMLPAALVKQLPAATRKKFVVNRGFEKHLNLYPFDVWKTITERMSKLNLFNTDNRIFYRKFHDGATEMFLDGLGKGKAS